MKKEVKAALARAQAQARGAKSALHRMGFEVSHSQALEVAAGTFGHATWHAYRAALSKSVSETSGSDAEEGWFDVLAYKTKERWEGPDAEDDCVEGFMKLTSAVACAQSLPFADYYQVVIVACGTHLNHDRGERVYHRFDRRPEFEQKNSGYQLVTAALYADDIFRGKDTYLVASRQEAREAVMDQHWNSRLDSVATAEIYLNEELLPEKPTVAEITDWLTEQGVTFDDLVRFQELTQGRTPAPRPTPSPDQEYEYALDEVEFMMPGPMGSVWRLIASLKKELKVDSWPFDV